MFQNTSILFSKKTLHLSLLLQKKNDRFFAEIIKVWNAKIARLGRR